jgi:hypothetical protein
VLDSAVRLYDVKSQTARALQHLEVERAGVCLHIGQLGHHQLRRRAQPRECRQRGGPVIILGSRSGGRD